MNRRRIRLLVLDNEGTFSPAKGQSLPLPAIARLRRLLRDHPSVGFSFSTGRPVPYVEAMLQVVGQVDSWAPSLCEGGGVLYWPQSDRSEFLTRSLDATKLLAGMPRGPFRIEPGKHTCVTIYPNPPMTVDSLREYASRSISSSKYTLATSSAAVDITPRGVDKGFGLRLLAKRTGCSLQQVLCIGDSDNDIPMLRIAGYSACPDNATESVKATVRYVSRKHSIAGVLDILAKFHHHFE